MSLCSYLESKRISEQDHDFDALIMAAMRKADDINLERLQATWPEIWEELFARYYADGGILPGDKAAKAEEEPDIFKCGIGDAEKSQMPKAKE